MLEIHYSVSEMYGQDKTFFYLLISGTSFTNFMLKNVIVLPLLKGFKHDGIVLCLELLKNVTFLLY